MCINKNNHRLPVRYNWYNHLEKLFGNFYLVWLNKKPIAAEILVFVHWHQNKITEMVSGKEAKSSFIYLPVKGGQNKLVPSDQIRSDQSLSRVQLFATYELQHARPPCPSTTPGVHSESLTLSQWCHPAISSSVAPFSSCPQSLPASESFPMSQLFA